jgi:hypothetical protein
MEPIVQQFVAALRNMEQSEVVALVEEELVQHVPDDVLRDIMSRIITQ